MDTSQKLKALISSGWTQTAISRETGIPQGTISRIVRGKHNDPRASKAALIDRLYERELMERKTEGASQSPSLGDFGEPRTGTDRREDSDRRVSADPSFGELGEPRDGDRRQEDRRATDAA